MPAVTNALITNPAEWPRSMRDLVAVNFVAIPKALAESCQKPEGSELPHTLQSSRVS